jgi:hypothetical protein
MAGMNSPRLPSEPALARESMHDSSRRELVRQMIAADASHQLTMQEVHLLTAKPAVRYGRRRSDFPGRRTTDGMAAKEELQCALQGELNFIISGGYRGVKRTPEEPTPMFRHSEICINQNKEHATSCDGCTLMHFVPPAHRKDEAPCYAIPLDTAGHTVNDLAAGPEIEIEQRVAAWLRRMLKELER